MKPDFALTLSFEGISLLRRVPGGWALVGDVALDSADLRGDLANLRSQADALSKNGGQVKLVIPNEQIKYLTLPDAGLGPEALQADIRNALNGATPYAVDDLRFDWAIADGQVFVAAVATETLDEAEAFAKSHHFDPVSIVATAPDNAFSGEVFFGQAATWTGDAPTKDDDAIQIVDAPEEEEPAPDLPIVDLDAAASEELLLPSGDQEQSIEDDALAPGAADPQAPEPDPVIAAPPPSATPSFASIRASRNAPPPPTPVSAPKPVAAPPADAADVKPRFKLGGARKSTRDSDVTAPVLQVEATEPSAERKGFGFFSSRKKAAPEPEAPPPPPVPAAEPQLTAKPAHDPGPARAAVARIAAMRAGRDPDKPAEAVAAAPDERDRMTIFGARTAPQVGGKPRFLGLMLTSALLIFLLAVAAWASVFLDEGISRFFDREDRAPSIARLPDVELQPLDGSITAPDVEDGVEVASLETGEELFPADDGLSNILPPPAALTPEEADARYAATGIWLRSPDAPAAPPLTTLDDLYIASIDGRVQQFDAVALPGADLLRNDETYLSQPNPALPGTRFELNDRGLVVATPEGAVNPEGVRIFAGLPPVVPPTRPIAPPVAPTDAEIDPPILNAALQAFRPKTRPDGLIEGNERSLLGGNTRAELAAFRPNARPAAVKAAEEEAQPEATEFAVAQSAEPVTRPRNFARIVEQAKKAQETETQVTQVAAVAPRTVQPRIPSSASVARQATVTNAINLRRINLIGVYGKPSSRRALVRLSNGRYQKVSVGDRLDGGRVAAIGNSELRYTKGGRNITLDMPD